MIHKNSAGKNDKKNDKKLIHKNAAGKKSIKN
jgi:hypothetical protein